MFDPTVFDNLKVIIEGYIYDLDQEKEVIIINRSDLVDLATMSRSYTIAIKKSTVQSSSLSIQLKMNHEQLAGELLNKIESPGCLVSLYYDQKGNNNIMDEFFLKKLNKAWEHTDIRAYLTQEITSSKQMFIKKYQVEFKRMFGEDSIEQLIGIIEDSISILKNST